MRHSLLALALLPLLAGPVLAQNGTRTPTNSGVVTGQGWNTGQDLGRPEDTATSRRRREVQHRTANRNYPGTRTRGLPARRPVPGGSDAPATQAAPPPAGPPPGDATQQQAAPARTRGLRPRDTVPGTQDMPAARAATPPAPSTNETLNSPAAAALLRARSQDTTRGLHPRAQVPTGPNAPAVPVSATPAVPPQSAASLPGVAAPPPRAE